MQPIRSVLPGSQISYEVGALREQVNAMRGATTVVAAAAESLPGSRVLTAGAGISIETDGERITVSATGAGGGAWAW